MSQEVVAGLVVNPREARQMRAARERLEQRVPQPEELRGQVGNCHCGAWWTGHNQSHCTSCHETFSGVSAFDKHHRNGHRHPEKVDGLVAFQRRFGRMWAPPQEEADAA